MTGNIEIREATAADAQAIQAVARASWHAAYQEILAQETIPEVVDSWYDPERLVRDDIQADSRPVFVAERDDVVGFIEGIDDDTVDDGSGKDHGGAELYRFYVRPDSWGEGIGTALLERLESRLREMGFSELRLTVFAANDVGVQFYESRGFERVDEERDEQFDRLRYEYVKSLSV